MKLKSKVDRAFLRSSAVFTPALPLTLAGQQKSEGLAITLATWPRSVYKENDGILQAPPTDLIVREPQNRAIDSISANLEFYSGGRKNSLN